jgi:hypothetical protein
MRQTKRDRSNQCFRGGRKVTPEGFERDVLTGGRNPADSGHEISYKSSGHPRRDGRADDRLRHARSEGLQTVHAGWEIRQGIVWNKERLFLKEHVQVQRELRDEGFVVPAVPAVPA